MPGKHRSATNPDQPQQADNVATRDRMASHGDDYVRDNNRSGEGNDASLTAGPTFVREVPSEDGKKAPDKRGGKRTSDRSPPADDDAADIDHDT